MSSANGKMDDPLVLLEMREIRASVEIEKVSQSSSWLAFFQTAGNRRRFFVIILLGTATQWSGNGVVQVSRPVACESQSLTTVLPRTRSQDCRDYTTSANSRYQWWIVNLQLVCRHDGSRTC